MYNFIADSLVN